MKNIQYIICSILMLASLQTTMAQQNPAALNPLIDKRPLDGLWDEFDFSFWVGNNGTIPISAVDSLNLMRFDLSLSKSKPKGPMGVSIIGTDALSGDALDYFTITYNEEFNTFTGIQKINKPLSFLDMKQLVVHAIVTTESSDYTKAEIGGAVDITPNPTSIGGQNELDDNVEFFTYTLSILPIHIFKLKAINNGGKAQLEWEASTDAEASYFSIEKSEDGLVFTSIGKMSVTSTVNTVTKYSFEDPRFTKTSFYRIVVYDKSGKSKISNIEALSKTPLTGIQVFPNPAKIFVVVSGLKDKQKLVLSDYKGSVLQQLNVTGSNQYINLNGLAAGTYFVKIVEDGISVANNKFIIY
jgi:hypothetical protein